MPLQWLQEYCHPALDVREVGQRLTLTGTKVEAVHHHGVAAPECFVVGRVLAVEPHPDADRLSVCSVNIGKQGAAQIVCGAANVAVGQTVAVARPGAVLPDGTRLKATKLRGVLSDGMILAEDELALGTDHSGIMVLDELAVDGPLQPGTPLAQLLPIATAVLELEITPNRPDCLAVYGVARELHAATGAPLAPAPWREDPGREGDVPDILVAVHCPELCPRFTLRRFDQVRIGPSPPWLRARLMAVGQRPINNVVDITNYVMLLTGQPLHAFDLDRVSGGRLDVRRAHSGEQVATLDGQVRTLDEQMVLIADGEGPTSIAGVMGGARSEVQADTTRVLVEAATWDGPNIHRTAWTLGLRSEASGRFEKGLAPEQTLHAQAVAAQMMIALGGARLVPGTVDVGGPGPEPAAIRLRERRVQSILGAPIAIERQAQILQALDFDTVPRADGLEVRVPPERRLDVTREADLIEEVSRLDGLERLPATLPSRRGAFGRLSSAQRLRRRAADALVGRGLYEVVGWTFTSAAVLQRLRLEPGDARRDAPALRNPLSADRSLLRSLLLGSLLDVARHNLARGAADLALFEIGTVFCAAPLAQTGVSEQRHLGVLLTGRLGPASWRTQTATTDFFAAKGVLEALGRALRVEIELRPAPQPFLHPGRSAEVRAAEEPIGWIGELHPLVGEAWDLPATAVLEVDLDALVAAAAAADRLYNDLISYPALRQDLAVTVGEDVAAAEVLATVRHAAGELLDEVRVFDVYRGPQVGEGRRSLALALSFRGADRTLTDEDILPLRTRIVEALRERLGGELRA